VAVHRAGRAKARSSGPPRRTGHQERRGRSHRARRLTHRVDPPRRHRPDHGSCWRGRFWLTLVTTRSSWRDRRRTQDRGPHAHSLSVRSGPRGIPPQNLTTTAHPVGWSPRRLLITLDRDADGEPDVLANKGRPDTGPGAAVGQSSCSLSASCRRSQTPQSAVGTRRPSG
jgi:hypothetical protein